MKTRARTASSSSKPPAAKQSESARRDGRTRRPMHRIYEIHARTTNVILTTNVIKKALGLLLDEEEQKVETAARKRDAK